MPTRAQKRKIKSSARYAKRVLIVRRKFAKRICKFNDLTSQLCKLIQSYADKEKVMPEILSTKIINDLTVLNNLFQHLMIKSTSIEGRSNKLILRKQRHWLAKTLDKVDFVIIYYTSATKDERLKNARRNQI